MFKIPEKFKKPIRRNRLTLAVGGFILALVFHLVLLTVRVKFLNRPEFEAYMRAQNGKGVIGAAWHQGIAYLLYIFGRVYNLPKYNPTVGLASSSTDGIVAGKVAKSFGFNKIVKGSSTKKGMQGLLEMAKLMRKENYSAGLLIDAPRGPIFHAKPGVIALARLTGCSIITCACTPTRYWQLNTWDKMIVPKPFSTVYLLSGADVAFSVPRNITETETEAYRQKLEQTMFDLQKKCDLTVQKLLAK